MMKVVVLGSTGSIGRQALEVIGAHPERFELVGLVAGHDGTTLGEQARMYRVERTGLGADAAVELAVVADADIVLNAIVGAAGLRASVAALGAGKTLALANKESLVAGGEVCRATAAAGGGTLVPVDSEHAAIAQCLRGRDRGSIARIVLTASGGPFRTRRDLDGVTPTEALEHPTWSMGPKITVDSATLMNKGLEIIEAHHLFDLGYEVIDVVVHPQSIVHGIVHFIDGTTIMQAAPADMKIPIAAALWWPEVPDTAVAPIDPAEIGPLEFEEADHVRFPLLLLARKAGDMGATYPAVLNAANEVAVAAFLDGRLPFTGIARVVEDVLELHEPLRGDVLEDVLAADAWAREAAAA